MKKQNSLSGLISITISYFLAHLKAAHISRFSLTSLWRQVFWHLNHNCLLPLPLGLSAMTDRQAVQPYLAIEADKPATRSNDSRTGPANSIWFGTMGRKLEAGAGCVYHVRNRQITPLFPATSIPNATCFSQDGRLAYLADTPPTRAIYKIALDEETGLPAGEKELFVDLAPEGLNPDGAVLDSAGRVWNAQWGLAELPVMMKPAGLSRPCICPPARLPAPVLADLT